MFFPRKLSLASPGAGCGARLLRQYPVGQADEEKYFVE
jgi:hypothetical protein